MIKEEDKILLAVILTYIKYKNTEMNIYDVSLFIKDFVEKYLPHISLDDIGLFIEDELTRAEMRGGILLDEFSNDIKKSEN